MSKRRDVELGLRQAIANGEFPPNAALRMEVLKQRFEVGFSPIREALAQLASEGLVNLVPNKGFHVASLSPDQLYDVAFVRFTVESAALRRAMERGDDHWEGEVIAAMHRYRRKAQAVSNGTVGFESLEVTHDDLHRALVSACGSPRLLDFQRRLQEQHASYRRLIRFVEIESEAHIEEHEKLVALTLERNVDAAVAELEQHLQITVDILQAAHFWKPNT